MPFPSPRSRLARACLMGCIIGTLLNACVPGGSKKAHTEEPQTPCVEAVDCGPGTHSCIDLVCVTITCSDSPCSGNTECVDSAQGYACDDCPTGYQGDGTTCEDIDECTDTAAACAPNATCTNNTGGFTCACTEGYFGDGATCTAVTECAPGQYVSAPQSPRADQTCAPCTAETYSATRNAATCHSMTVCTAGQSVIVEGTSSSDRQCGACHAGSFSADNNAAACTPHTTCEPGQWVSQAGTTLNDRNCEGCGEGTFSTTTNAAACTPWQECNHGFAESTPGSSTADRSCGDIDECANGALACADNASCHNVDGSASCACDEGYFGNGATVCYPWSTCEAGEFIAVEPTASTDRVCQGCPEGYYNDALNATQCEQDCTGDAHCGADSYGCTEDGRCTELMPCTPALHGRVGVSGRGPVPTNVECTFQNQANQDETGRCVYSDDTEVFCRRTCSPDTGNECTTGDTVCQKSAPWSLNNKHPEGWEAGDPTTLATNQGHCAAPCATMSDCNGATYQCDTAAGTCTWPQQSHCQGKSAGDACWIPATSQNGVCGTAFVFPYAGDATDSTGLYCSKACGPNTAGTTGDAAICGGYKVKCTSAPDAGGSEPVYNVCAPSCSQAGPTFPAVLGLLAGALFLRRRKRQPNPV